MTTDEIVPILEGLDEYNMTEVGFQDTANALTPIPLLLFPLQANCSHANFSPAT